LASGQKKRKNYHHGQRQAEKLPKALPWSVGTILKPSSEPISQKNSETFYPPASKYLYALSFTMIFFIKPGVSISNPVF
jgi:hypothetical protein